MMTTRKKLGTSLGFIALGIVALTVYVWFRQVNMVTLPEDRSVFSAIFIAAALMALSSFVIGTRWFGAIPAVLAIVGSAFMSMTAYISPQQVADNPVIVGDVIPQFIALDDDQNRFNSNQLNGKPTLIKFFRGHW